MANTPRLLLRAETAADLMRPNPVSIRDTATVAEATALLTDKGFSGAPVIDEAGRPIGVLSRADILAHDRERLRSPPSGSEYYMEAEIAQRQATAPGEKHAPVLVCDLMTPAVFSVAPDATAEKVIREMLALKVHRLFVVDAGGVLIGVISVLDVLRHLQSEP
ncbi:MAG TPA: CBS domain-containing protein [Gemmataceae bacterium]|nr:CBS domain-containing protein [Gemmataceae bacterium]